MASGSAALTGDKIRDAARYADARGGAEPGAQGVQSSPFDVWSHSWDGLAADVRQIAADPTRAVTEPVKYVGDLAGAVKAGLWREQNSQDAGAALESAEAQLDALGEKAAAIARADGALATVGATFDFLTSAEQFVSWPLSMIPFPAFPALRIGDLDFGMPHGHAHPPNLTPLGMIFLPSTGPVIPIPIFSGASRTLINNMPAARCGDMGLSIWCGGFVPLYEIFLGSSSVWIEGARAARTGVDITNHCVFSVRPRPSDPPIGSFNGTTYTGSPNVVIGGVPTPSLLSLALGQVFKVMFQGAAKAVSKLRAWRAAQEAAQAAAEQADQAADLADEADAFADEITAVMPPVRDAIDDLLWQFSDAVRDLVRLSPTLRRQLEILEAHGWSVGRGQSGGYFCNRNGQFIRMVERADAGREVVELAHEVGHAHFNQLPEVPPTGLSRDEFVRANVARDMVDEGAAQFNAAKVRDELAQAGHDAPMPGQHADEYADIYDRYKAGQVSEPEAINEMGDVMRREVTSGDQRPYEEYYGDPYRDWYDRNVAAPPASAAAPSAPAAGSPHEGAPPDAGDTLRDILPPGGSS